MKSKCRVCLKHKLLSSFWKDKSRGSGVCSICKDCYRNSEYGDKKRTYIREYMKKYIKDPKNQNKLNARKITKQAIKDKILKVLPCEVCGQKAEAHHPNYNDPMNIKWLCDLHHRELHVNLTNGK
jgi:hypothetical protein